MSNEYLKIYNGLLIKKDSNNFEEFKMIKIENK